MASEMKALPTSETLVVDTESDGYLADATKLHSIQVGTVDGDDAVVYCDALPDFPSISEGLARIKAARRVIGHNFIKHDAPLINKFYPGTIRREQVVDTLVMVRLLDPEERNNTLRALGERLGVLKADFEGPWDTCTPEMMAYAKQDIPATRAVYHHAKAVEGWGESLQLEMDTAWAIAAQEANGFRFDVKAAEELEVELRGELEDIKNSLRNVFPSIWAAADKAPFTPKSDNKRMGYVGGAPLSKVKLEVFNPASRKQVGDRLRRLGWKPKAFGADGSPTVDEAILATLPYAEAQRLVVYFTQLKKLGQLSDGKTGWLKVVRPDGRVYGRVNPNGAATGRMSHFAPNVAQVNKDPRMRALWLPREGWALVGCDAEGLEARMLAHYLTRYDNGAFTDTLLNGKKEDATDVHSANAAAVNAAGFKVNRDGAKTLLYALIYGAGDGKLGSSVVDNLRAQGLVPPRGNPVHVGRAVRAALARSMRGIDLLTEAVKEKAKTAGYLTALDGRRLLVRSEHAALNTLLQGGGAIVMKKALCLFMAGPLAAYHDTAWNLCANVHDEVQIETMPYLAEGIGQAFADCIRLAGEALKVRCPLAGAYAIGTNWSETH